MGYAVGIHLLCDLLQGVVPGRIVPEHGEYQHELRGRVLPHQRAQESNVVILPHAAVFRLLYALRLGIRVVLPDGDDNGVSGPAAEIPRLALGVGGVFQLVPAALHSGELIGAEVSGAVQQCDTALGNVVHLGVELAPQVQRVGEVGVIQAVAVILRVALPLVIYRLCDLSGGNAVAVDLQLHVVLMRRVRHLRALVHDYPGELQVVVRRHRLEYPQGVALVLQSLGGGIQVVLPVGGEGYLLHHAVNDNGEVGVLLEVDVLQHHRRGSSRELHVSVASGPYHDRVRRILVVDPPDILEARAVRRNELLPFFYGVSHVSSPL